MSTADIIIESLSSNQKMTTRRSSRCGSLPAAIHLSRFEREPFTERERQTWDCSLAFKQAQGVGIRWYVFVVDVHVAKSKMVCALIKIRFSFPFSILVEDAMRKQSLIFCIHMSTIISSSSSLLLARASHNSKEAIAANDLAVKQNQNAFGGVFYGHSVRQILQQQQQRRYRVRSCRRRREWKHIARLCARYTLRLPFTTRKSPLTLHKCRGCRFQRSRDSAPKAKLCILRSRCKINNGRDVDKVARVMSGYILRKTTNLEKLTDDVQLVESRIGSQCRYRQRFSVESL
jgi:hypothetical protein